MKPLRRLLYTQGETTHAAVPTAVFGSLCLIDAIIIYAFLPETSGTAMPDTISDVEDEFMAVNNDADERSRYGATD